MEQVPLLATVQIKIPRAFADQTPVLERLTEIKPENRN